VADGWKQAQSLLVVPHGPLAQLPLALLPTRPVRLGAEEGAIFANYRAIPWLIRSHALTMLPSVTALATLRALPPGDPNRRPFVGFGDPYFSEEQASRAARAAGRVEAAAVAGGSTAVALRSSPKTREFDSSQLAMLPRLPETADEIQSIALAMSADVIRDVFVGARANERTVKTLNLSGYRVIAFATHGLVAGELDGLTQPALALSAPEVADVDGDGLLTMEEILGLRLNADWVVLSACNTASGQGAGSEAVSGLGRAFFYAGARALLVSNWPVETTSARELTTDLFRRQSARPGLSRAEALQRTMNALIDGPGFTDPGTGKVVFTYAHPIFWAPFTLVGDGGGS
jgi:CHAT domain-containing protein